MQLPIRVGIVDDHAIIRAGLRQFLETQADLEVSGEAADGAAALRLVRTQQLNVLVMDISMPGQSGIEVMQRIKAQQPALPVLIFSSFPEEHYAPTLIRQGANGYLNKECDPDVLIQAIRVVSRGRKYISPEVGELLAESLTTHANKLPHESLSDREFQVFLRLAGGETVGHVADSLCLSVKTVSTYRTRILEKLRLASNSDLTYYAMKNKLIS